jgi:hypothetical protein
MAQHIPRLVSLAQLAESMGCEYFGVFADDVEHLVADPNLTDLWVQAITQIRGVFSGELTSGSGCGYQAEIEIGILPDRNKFCGSRMPLARQETAALLP